MSKSAKEYRDKFYDVMVEFISKLCRQFPDNVDLEEGRKGLEILNKTVLITNFEEMVMEHKDKVMKKNEMFFLTEGKETLTNNADKFDNTTENELSEVFDNLSALWKVCNKQTKESIWQYLQKLVLLCEKYSIQRDIEIKEIMK